MPFKELSPRKSLFFQSKFHKGLLPISQLEQGSELYSTIMHLEQFIMRTGLGIHDPMWAEKEKLPEPSLKDLRRIIDTDINKHGELYQYWFDASAPGIAYPGNNILLLAISRACHSVSDAHTDHIERMLSIILKDASRKLSPEQFMAFISFRFVPSKKRDFCVDYYFDNTPLTLAIKSGLIGIAQRLLQTRKLSPEDINARCGEGYFLMDGDRRIDDPCLLTAAHLAALRFNVTGLSADFLLLQQLQTCGANFLLPDEHKNTVYDLITFNFPQFHPECGARYDDTNSAYAHHLNYDHRLMDVYRQPDPFNRNAELPQRHPELFHPCPNSAEIMDRVDAIKALMGAALFPSLK